MTPKPRRVRMKTERWTLARQNGLNPPSFRLVGIFNTKAEATDYKREHGMRGYQPRRIKITEITS